jgi:hypothetical protein
MTASGSPALIINPHFLILLDVVPPKFDLIRSFFKRDQCECLNTPKTNGLIKEPGALKWSKRIASNAERSEKSRTRRESP